VTTEQKKPAISSTRPSTKRRLLGLGVILAGFMMSAAGAFMATPINAGEVIPVSQLSTLVEEGQVTSAVSNGSTVTVETSSGATYTSEIAPIALANFSERLGEQGVIVGVAPSRPFSSIVASPMMFGIPVWVLPAFMGLSAGLMLALVPSPSGQTDPNIKKKEDIVGRVGSQAKEELEDRFDDLVGCDEVVEEVAELVDYLQDPERYELVGASMPRGLLLVGQPGTGKTKLARAVAGEADADFFFASGSDFVEVFVGVGSSRIRDLFKRARESERAVIFIDEIDAIGRARSNDLGPGNREYDNTLNSLLVEMDGFEQTDHVIVLAATNRPELLDAALLRPGRFDRKVFVSAPDAGGRVKLLKRLLETKPTEENIDLNALGRKTMGMTGADLQGIVNEAAIAAAKNGRDKISNDDLAEAVRIIHGGRERPNATRVASDVEIIAWHEAGHALCAHLTPGAQEPEEVSIVARGLAGGVTWMLPRDNMLTVSAAQADLCTLMGGRAAEELLLNGDYTTGAQGDLRSATDLAERMVFELGMTGTLAVHNRNGIRLPDSKLDGMVEELIQGGLDAARKLLNENRDSLEAVAKRLLDVERINQEDISAIVSEKRT
jgi:cell division protease FtsH